MVRAIARFGGRLLIIAVVAAVAVLTVYAVDTWAHTGRLGRNVTVAGYVVADGTVADLDRVLRAEQAAADELPVVIRTEGLTIETTVAESGVSIDTAAVTEAAFAVWEADGFVDQFNAWIDSLRGTTNVPLTYQLDGEGLREVVEQNRGTTLRHPREPSFTGISGSFEATTPIEGAYLDADDVVAALAASVAAGPPPYTIDVAPRTIPTTFTQKDLDLALVQAEELASRLTVSINGRRGIIGAQSVRRWVESDIVDGALVPTFVPDRVQAAVESQFVGYATPLPEPLFSAEDGEVKVDFGGPAQRCCAAGVSPLLFEAAVTGDAQAVELPTALVEDDLGRGRADAFGIKELISTFTTNHACCQGRVANIHRIADIVRGQIIMPGETFSVNDFVGRRTRENGFVAAGVIQSGRFTDQVGGGISQFATTTFNAAFFAGMDIDEYQSHSIYIGRYPYGREATLSFPQPDLELTNVSPYAVMLWPTYTDRSITVEIYSTPYFDVEQTRQTSFKIGQCTRVNTYRQRTTPDGTAVEDFFIATYRPGEGLDCNGNPTPQP